MGIQPGLPTGLAAIFWGVLTFSILVVLHEGGHFLAARAFGVKVHEFMIGLPGPALRWRSKRTGVAYGVTAIPLGGYVRIAGMEPGPEDPLLGRALAFLVDHGSADTTELSRVLEVDRDRALSLLTTLEDYLAAESIRGEAGSRSLVERAAGEDDDALLARVRSTVYKGQRPWKRMLILSMGVIVNLVTAVLVFTVVLSAFGKYVPSSTSLVGGVVAGGPAASAGMKAGDVVTRIGGTDIATWDQLRAAVATHKPAESVPVAVRRGGASLTLDVVLGSSTDPSRPGALLGVTSGVDQVKVPVLSALGESFSFIGLTFAAIADFFNPAKFATSVSNARSVVGISYEVARAAEAGPFQYAAMIALLSLSLGVINILPIPPLDGGKVAVELVEAVLRRPIPRRLSLGLSGVGAVLLFSLIFYLMYADVVRYVLAGS